MHIIRCEAAHGDEWNRFVQACPRASFYHRWEWREVNARNFNHQSVYLAALEERRIVGVFPLVQLKSLLFGNIACSMPFVNYGGPCGETDLIERALLDQAAIVAGEWGVDYLEIRSLRDLGDELPCADHKVSMTIALESDPEAVMERFKREHRKEIRRALKSGFTARFGPDLLDDFYDVLVDSWRDLGTPIYRREYLRAIVEAFPGATRVCVVYDEHGRAAAGAFSGVHGVTMEGMWLGARSEYRKQLVGYVLYWELIRDACESGCASFHLGRSSRDSGGEQFKRKWNAETQQLYWHYLLRSRTDVPSLNPNNPKYRLAIQAWRRLPAPVTRVVGPFFARSIP